MLLVEGVSGNDGNVFDVAVSQAEDGNQAIDGLKLYSFMPTFQVPRGNKLAELGLDVPADAKALSVENFDAAGGAITFAGRFRSAALSASGKSQWRRDEIVPAADEPGQTASLTVAEGNETPNDLTIFVGEHEAGGDPVDKPVAINLPVHAFAPNRRPEIALAVTPLACGLMRFDASASRDPDGGALSHRWRLGAEHGRGRDGRETVRRARPLSGPPRELRRIRTDRQWQRARLLLPGQGAACGEFCGAGAGRRRCCADARRDRLDQPCPATGQPHRQLPMVDGRRPGDRAEGRRAWLRASSTIAMPSHGVYDVTLTVTDSADNPCNTATATRSITVNAPPVANAGGNRSIALGDTLTFDAGATTDADGDAVKFRWDFGDGATAETAKAPHRFERPGTYAVILTADDGKGADNSVSSDRASIFVNASPQGDDAQIPSRLVVGMAGLFDASQAIDSDGEIVKTDVVVRRRHRQRQGDRSPFLRQARHL